MVGTDERQRGRFHRFHGSFTDHGPLTTTQAAPPHARPGGLRGERWEESTGRARLVSSPGTSGSPGASSSIWDWGFWIWNSIENRQSQRFMVPFFTKKQIDSLKNACRKLIAVNYESETTENKWQRWKDERALQPKPTGKFRIALPEWASEDEIDTEIDKYLERRRK